MRIFLLTVFCIVSLQALSQKGNNNSFYKPRPKTFIPVNDFAGILTKDQKTSLNTKLLHYGDTSSNAIVIITQKTLKDTSTGEVYQLEEAAKHYFNNWGIGLKEKNNGVLFFVVKDDRKIRIATGSGIEDILTNNDCQEIIDNNIIPNFKNKNYYKGLDEATGKAMEILSPELYASANAPTASLNDTPPPPTDQSYSYTSNEFNHQQSAFPFIVLIIIVAGIILIIAKLVSSNADNTVYNSSGAYNSSFSNRRGFMSGLFLGNFFNNRNSSNNNYNNVTNNNYNDNNSSSFDSGFSSSSSDSFSSSSDSGSSSFDGGSSDGGGASGSW